MCSSNIDLNSVSVKDRNRSALDLNGVNVIDEVPSNMFYMNECATLPVDISNVGTEINLAGSTEDKVSLHKLVATCPTLLNTVLSTRNTQSKVSYTPKNEIIGIKPTIDKSPSTTPATYRIISNKRSKAKESWFEANIQDFENSPDVQRGRPSLHILKDKGIVQSLTKQFS
ncbi:unnamed protein product [Meganyctiphanes norvegica]|uniref:Uncharacterized protein n=1 Tax=Meganyctiphanes norvegica TaxID=48144 RepID=A0AAV2QVG9_MEGNR